MSGAAVVDDARWNGNIHHHPVILAALAVPCGRVLDVGCGEGILTRSLRARSVVGIDMHAPSIQLARSTPSDIEWIVGDALTHPFEPSSFDAIVGVSMLHHVDPVVALRRFASLLCPGGVLAFVGVARSRYPRDLPRDGVATIAARLHRLNNTYWEHSAPMMWPPPLTFAQTKNMLDDTLPGVRFRRHLMFRYSFVWTKPLGT